MTHTIRIHLLPLLWLAAVVSGADGQVPTNVAVIQPGDSPQEIVRKAARVSPSRQQLIWQEREFIAFAHFGMDTFTDREWGEGTERPELFNPSDFDARQWVKVLKEAGMKMLIVTAKHHDGFCLWPSNYTGHSVKSSPWRGGRGDVVRDVADACREAGMGFGVYLSPWDRHEPSYGNSPAYNEFFRNQLRELLTSYGEISEVWFDGACGEGPNGKKQLYDWQSYYSVIRELQPNAVIFGMGPDVRWVGTESGYGRETEWSVVPDIVQDPDRVAASSQAYPLDGAFVPKDLTGEDLGSRQKILNTRTLIWYPAETDVSIRPGWFYHASQDDRVKTPEKLVDIYYSSVGRNSVLLLNVPPDKRGRIHGEDIRSLRGMRKILDETFQVNLAHGASVVSTSEQKGRGPALAVDGDRKTSWMAGEGVESATLELTLTKECRFDRAMLAEDIAEGQRVEKFHLVAWNGAEWLPFAKGTTIGYMRLLRFPVVKAARVRLVIEESRLNPTLCEFGLFKAPPSATIEPEGGAFTDSVRVSLCSDEEGAALRYTLDGRDPDSSSPLYTGPLTFTSPTVLTATARSADGSESLPVTARFQKAKHGILLTTRFSPQYTGGGPLALIDGMRGSRDFSDGRWQGYEGVDLEAVLDLGRERPVSKVSASFLENTESWIFLPEWVEFAVSGDGKEFTTVGRVNGSPGSSGAPLIQSFDAAAGNISCRYVRMHAKNIGVCPPGHPGAGGKAWIFADEVTVE